MPKLPNLTLLAVASGLLLCAPAIAAPAAPGNGGPNAKGPAVDCALPENANSPYCLQLKKTNPNNPAHGTAGGNSLSNATTSGKGSGGPGGFTFSQHDRDQFHRDMRGFNFGVFATPNFSIRLGITVPHSYKLRHVPYRIYHRYPQFRGYLFFVARNGDVVIVSPRSFRIVAVL